MSAVWQTVIEADLEAMVADLSPMRRQAFVARLLARYGGDLERQSNNRPRVAPTPIYAQTSLGSQLEWHSDAS